MSDQGVVLALVRGELPARPASVSDACWSLALRCLAPVPDNRPSAEQIVTDSLFDMIPANDATVLVGDPASSTTRARHPQGENVRESVNMKERQDDHHRRTIIIREIVEYVRQSLCYRHALTGRTEPNVYTSRACKKSSTSTSSPPLRPSRTYRVPSHLILRCRISIVGSCSESWSEYVTCTGILSYLLLRRRRLLYSPRWILAQECQLWRQSRLLRCSLRAR